MKGSHSLPGGMSVEERKMSIWFPPYTLTVPNFYCRSGVIVFMANENIKGVGMIYPPLITA